MSTKPTLRAVPNPTTKPTRPRTETEEKLWQALLNNPCSTATALSTTAGIGKSTAPKVLNRWESNGLVTRTAGIGDGGARPADRWTITAIGDQATDDQPTAEQPAAVEPEGQSERLAPGGLRGLVEDYLRDNSGEFTPNAIGKALNRSSGAVHNALEKLIESGYAARTCDKPKKYSLAVTPPEATK